MDVAVAISERLRTGHQHARLPVVRTTATAAMVALSAVAAVLGASATTTEPTANAVVRAAMVAAPMAVGLHAAKVQRHERFARLLYATGAVAFLTTLAESPNSDLYTVGRIAGWGLGVFLAVLILAYPSGRLETRTDRRLAMAMAGALGVFFLPTALLAEQFPLPSPWTSCGPGGGCPSNSLFVLHTEPGFVDPLLRGGGAVCVFAILVAIVLRIEHRIATAPPAVRRTLVPVLAVGMAQATLVGVGVVARELDHDAGTVETVARLLALSTPAIAFAFLLGLLRARLSGEWALRRFAYFVQALPDAAAVRRALGETLGDPTTEIAFPDGANTNRWIDETGQSVRLPQDDPGRATYVVSDRETVVAAIIHDADHAIEPRLCDAAASLASVAFDNQRLANRARDADREVVRSRARIATTADAERRRIERDLHDGAQQRLVALRIELGLLEDLAERHPERLPERLHELERNAEEALDELRALAHGVCPPLLTDRGIVEALRAAAQRCTTPVVVRATCVGRYAPEVETAVYFCALEALQNIDKHAAGARHAGMELDGADRGELRFVVRDDGPGAEQADLEGGAGLLNMADRIQAIGGSLTVASSPGRGTTVGGSVPVLRPAAPPPDRGPAIGPATS